MYDKPVIMDLPSLSECVVLAASAKYNPQLSESLYEPKIMLMCGPSLSSDVAMITSLLLSREQERSDTVYDLGIGVPGMVSHLKRMDNTDDCELLVLIADEIESYRIAIYGDSPIDTSGLLKVLNLPLLQYENHSRNALYSQLPRKITPNKEYNGHQPEHHRRMLQR